MTLMGFLKLIGCAGIVMFIFYKLGYIVPVAAKLPWIK